MSNPIVTTEQQMRELLQPMLKDAQMQAWREGTRDGFKMARNVVEVIRNEAAQSCTAECTPEDRIAYEAQIAVLSGLMSSFTYSAEHAMSQQNNPT